jgi:tetratricopeptide (TPR) repeat protein
VLADVELGKGYIAANYGEYGIAEPLVESNAPVLLASSQSLSTRMGIASTVGILRMGLGNHEGADRAFRERLAFRVEMGQGDSPFAAYDWWLIARNLSMQGRHAEAEAFLTSAPSFGNETGDRTSNYSDVIPDALARVRLDAQDIRGALQVLPASSIPAGKIDPTNTSSFYIDSWAFHGELACAAGQRVVGLSHLVMAEEALSRHISPNSPELARVRAVTGLCALSLGDRKRAEELASQARRAFVAQPRVGPYFKEPLGRLERQLGTKSI